MNIVCTTWELDEETGDDEATHEAFRDFEMESSHFAAQVTLEEQITDEPPDDPDRPWWWAVSRHDDDNRDDRRATDEEHEWIKGGYASTRQEGMARADEVLRAEGYTLE